jgi:hypothetical protein
MTDTRSEKTEKTIAKNKSIPRINDHSKDGHGITAISQSNNSDEYKHKSYEELSKEFQEVYPAAVRAFVLIPQMYNRLTLIDNLTHKDALTKIRNDHDHLLGFTERNIRRYLPANNPNIPRRVRTSCPKNSATETCVGIFFSDTIHKIERQSISNPVVQDISSDQTIQIEGVTSRSQIESDFGECSPCQELEEQLKKPTNLSRVDTIARAVNKSNKADLKTSVVNFEIPLPPLHRYIASQRKKGKDEAWFTITINAITGKLISIKTGRNPEIEKNLFKVIYRQELPIQ